MTNYNNNFRVKNGMDVADTSTLSKVTIGLNNGARSFGNGFMPVNSNTMKIETPNNGASIMFAMKNSSGVQKNVGISRSGNIVVGNNGLIGPSFPTGLGIQSLDSGPIRIATSAQPANIYSTAVIITDPTAGITLGTYTYDNDTDQETSLDATFGLDGVFTVPTLSATTASISTLDGTEGAVASFAKFRAAEGSSSNYGYHFKNDTGSDTAMCSPSNDIIEFYTGGENQLTLDNVGGVKVLNTLTIGQDQIAIKRQGYNIIGVDGNWRVGNVLEVGTDGNGYITSTGDHNLVLQTSGNDGAGGSIVLGYGDGAGVQMFNGPSQTYEVANLNTYTNYLRSSQFEVRDNDYNLQAQISNNGSTHYGNYHNIGNMDANVQLNSQGSSTLTLCASGDSSSSGKLRVTNQGTANVQLASPDGDITLTVDNTGIHLNGNLDGSEGYTASMTGFRAGWYGGTSGYSFKSDGSQDTGMFSWGDGDLKLRANGENIIELNTTQVNINKDVIASGKSTFNKQMTLISDQSLVGSYPDFIPLRVKTYNDAQDTAETFQPVRYRGSQATPAAIQQSDSIFRYQSTPYTGAWADSNVFGWLSGDPLDGYSFGGNIREIDDTDFTDAPLYWNHIKSSFQFQSYNVPEPEHGSVEEVSYNIYFQGNTIGTFNGEIGGGWGGLASQLKLAPTKSDGFTEVLFTADAESETFTAPKLVSTNTATIAQAIIGLNNGSRAFGNGFYPANANNMKIENPNNGGGFNFAMKNPSGVERNVGISRQGNIVLANGVIGNQFPNGIGMSAQDGGAVIIATQFDDGETYKSGGININTGTGISLSIDTYDYATDTDVYVEMVLGVDGGIILPAVNKDNIQYNFDSSANVFTLATNGEFSFNNMSGEILVNDLYDGFMYKFLVGGGYVWLLGSTNPNWDSPANNTNPANSWTLADYASMSYDGSYTFKNLASSRDYSFYAVRTRIGT